MQFRQRNKNYGLSNLLSCFDKYRKRYKKNGSKRFHVLISFFVSKMLLKKNGSSILGYGCIHI